MQQAEEEINRQIRKEEIKLFLFTDDMIVYGENPKESTTKFLVCPRKLIREFSKVTGYKVNTQYFGILTIWQSCSYILVIWKPKYF